MQGGTDRRSVKTKAGGDKVCYSRQAPLNPFERPLRHLQAGSSIARSGPALNPLPAAWNGWREIPALRSPLSKRNGGRGGTGRDGRINKRAARVYRMTARETKGWRAGR